MTQSDLIQLMQRSEMRAVEKFPALALRPLGRLVPAEEVEQGALRLRDDLCSHPLYAAKAKHSEELTGEPMAFWRTLFASQINRYHRCEESSTAA